MFLIVIIWEMEAFNKIMTQKLILKDFWRFLTHSLTFRLRKINNVRFSIARWLYQFSYLFLLYWDAGNKLIQLHSKCLVKESNGNMIVLGQKRKKNQKFPHKELWCFFSCPVFLLAQTKKKSKNFLIRHSKE